MESLDISYSDHEALLADVTFDLGGQSEAADDNANRNVVLLEETSSILTAELWNSKWWQYAHVVFFATFLTLFFKISYLQILLVMASIVHFCLVFAHLERQSGLKAALQSLQYKKAKKIKK